jgi:signal transduction histidine kinase
VKNSFPEKPKKRSLKNLLIEPMKQVRFGIYMLVITISYSLITNILLVGSFYEQYRHVMAIFNVVDPHLRWELISDEVFYSNITRLAVCFVLFLIVLFTAIIKLTHRFYGPIVAIRKFIRELKEGNYSSRITLRRRDELQDIAKELNSLAEALEKRKGSSV